jgi:HK97 gp10 family phage protein
MAGRRPFVANVNVTLEKFKALEGGMEDGLAQIATAGALVLEASIKRDMATKKSGREYARGNKTHVASAPGESPAPDTGALLNSIQSELEYTTKTSASALVGTNQVYAVPLEFGTAKMEARPFMRPAAERSKADIEAAMRATAKRLVDQNA